MLSQACTGVTAADALSFGAATEQEPAIFGPTDELRLPLFEVAVTGEIASVFPHEQDAPSPELLAAIRAERERRRKAREADNHP